MEIRIKFQLLDKTFYKYHYFLLGWCSTDQKLQRWQNGVKRKWKTPFLVLDKGFVRRVSRRFACSSVHYKNGPRRIFPFWGPYLEWHSTFPPVEENILAENRKHLAKCFIIWVHSNFAVQLCLWWEILYRVQFQEGEFPKRKSFDNCPTTQSNQQWSRDIIPQRVDNIVLHKFEMKCRKT